MGREKQPQKHSEPSFFSFLFTSSAMKYLLAVTFLGSSDYQQKVPFCAKVRPVHSTMKVGLKNIGPIT
jgi:hypothetical protein